MPTTLRMPDTIRNRYTQLAKQTGRPASFYYKQALESSIGELEYEYGLMKDVEDYRAGKLETYSMDEVKAHCGL
jgi:RHH-type rel operon transcriptional repressor/antitoxin RelB